MKYFKTLDVHSGSEFTTVTIDLSQEDMGVKFGVTGAKFMVTLPTGTARAMTLNQLETEALKQMQEFRESAIF